MGGDFEKACTSTADLAIMVCRAIKLHKNFWITTYHSSAVSCSQTWPRPLSGLTHIGSCTRFFSGVPLIGSSPTVAIFCLVDEPPIKFAPPSALLFALHNGVDMGRAFSVLLFCVAMDPWYHHVHKIPHVPATAVIWMIVQQVAGDFVGSLELSNLSNPSHLQVLSISRGHPFLWTAHHHQGGLSPFHPPFSLAHGLS